MDAGGVLAAEMLHLSEFAEKKTEWSLLLTIKNRARETFYPENC